jgi:hypothetical protein
MGFVVLHIDKASGNDAAMTAHIERTIDPKNTDGSDGQLEKCISAFPQPVLSNHFIDNALESEILHIKQQS